MKIAIMQPYLFPYLGYFQLLAAADKFVMLDDVHFINKGWINRNRILINGHSTMFTLPLDQASQNKLIKDIQVKQDKRWVSKFLKSIEMSYKKAPYFKGVFPLIQTAIEREVVGISDMVYYSLLEINKYLKIETEIVPHSGSYDTKGLQGQDRIIEICSLCGASDYINPIGGLELYDRAKFEERNINLSFLSPVLDPYPQHSDVFIAGLSIIDVLMQNSPEQVNLFLKNYNLLNAK
ncbi:WbqC family protein [Anditalea andensis]|uniref:WbqC-like protein n=1 Tax=Anditalea andensis TaxID=1048983 RepID=A0A074L589_9BACT|nr:WbqC family protein [Anditalea andensis]KEO75003.1 hypothetical protein EL17_04835 [Anditalea andensis]